MTQNTLMITLFMALAFGCGERNIMTREREAKAATSYQASALLHFQGGEGPERLFSNQRKKLETEQFQEMVEKKFSSLWAEQNNPDLESQLPMPGKYSFSPSGGLVTLTAEASDPQVAVLTANVVAQSAESYFMEESRWASEESVAWLNKEVEKQKERLNLIDQDIHEIQRRKDNDDQLKHLLKKRDVQVKIINNIHERIEEERLRHEEGAVTVKIIERADEAYAK